MGSSSRVAPGGGVGCDVLGGGCGWVDRVQLGKRSVAVSS